MRLCERTVLLCLLYEVWYVFGYVLHFIAAKFLMGYLLYFANICESAFTWLGFIHVESTFSHVKIIDSPILKKFS